MSDIAFVDRRRASIGGSEISGVLGINPYVSPIDIYLEKTGRKEPFKGSLTTMRGNYLEPLVADEYARNTGFLVKLPHEMEWEDKPSIIHTGEDVIFLHPRYSFLRATPDRFAYTPFGTCHVLEIKTAVGFGVNKFQNGVPAHYRAQAIWNRGIMGMHLGMLEDICQVPVLLDDKYDCFDVEYKESEFEWMVEQAVKFWNEYILKDIPPSIDSIDDCKLMYPDTDGSIIDADDGLVSLVGDMLSIKNDIELVESGQLQAKESIARMKERYEQKELELRLALGSSCTVRFNEKNLITYNPVTGRAYFDTDAFKEAEPELYQQYLKRKPSSRQLRINYKVLGESL